MISSLLLAASLLAGVGTSSNLGETSPFAVAAADVTLPGLRGWYVTGIRPDLIAIDLTVDTARKADVPGRAYLFHGALQVRASDWLSIGLGQSYRHTSRWHKRVTWVLASVHSGPLTLRGEIAPESHNREAKVEARLRLCSRLVCAEARAWTEQHSQLEAQGAYAHGAAVLLGLGKR